MQVSVSLRMRTSQKCANVAMNPLSETPAPRPDFFRPRCAGLWRCDPRADGGLFRCALPGDLPRARLGDELHRVCVGRGRDLEEPSARAGCLHFVPSERPVTFQIFGADEDQIVTSCQRIEEWGPDIIDVNLGCSTPNVSGRGAGAGLLRDPAKIGRIFARLVAHAARAGDGQDSPGLG